MDGKTVDIVSLVVNHFDSGRNDIILNVEQDHVTFRSTSKVTKRVLSLINGHHDVTYIMLIIANVIYKMLQQVLFFM